MRGLLRLLAVVTVGFFPAQAFAQFSPNSGEDTELYADNVDSRGDVIIMTGQADIRQGDVRLLADRIEIYTEGGATGGLVSTEGFTRMVATGNFYYITPEQEVRGDKGVYTKANESFIVTGDVILLQDDSVVTGNRLDYNLTTRAAKVVSECRGRKCAKQDRVAILIRSNSNSQGTN